MRAWMSSSIDGQVSWVDEIDKPRRLLLSTLDVLRVDGLKIGSSLGSEAIIIMQHNGIPVEVLLRMSEQSLENIGKAFAPQPLATESEADARQRLISNVYSLGGVGF
jgi:hypothetical protein